MNSFTGLVSYPFKSYVKFLISNEIWRRDKWLFFTDENFTFNTRTKYEFQCKMTSLILNY